MREKKYTGSRQGQKRVVPDRPIYHVLNALGLVILAGIFLYLIIMWNQLPDEIPSHFNAVGVADAWSGKGMLWFCPVTGALLYGMITLLEQFPDIWNTGVEVTPENQDRVLGAVKLMVVWLKLSVVLAFSWITLCSARGRGLGAWFMLIFLVLIFAPIIFCMVQIFRSR